MTESRPLKRQLIKSRLTLTVIIVVNKWLCLLLLILLLRPTLIVIALIVIVLSVIICVAQVVIEPGLGRSGCRVERRIRGQVAEAAVIAMLQLYAVVVVVVVLD